MFIVLSVVVCVLSGCTQDDSDTDKADTTASTSGTTTADAVSDVSSNVPDSNTETQPDTATPDPFPADCVAEELEADFAPSPLSGAIVDPETGAILMPEDGSAVVVGVTYLRLQASEASQKRFGEAMGPILGSLGEHEGLLGYSLATSARCGTARTMTIWKDQAAMMGFVRSGAHNAAMGAISEISRGGSVTLHWETSNPEDIDWAAAVTHFVGHEGPKY